MSKKHLPPLLLKPNASARLNHFIRITHLLALLACLGNSLPVGYKAVLLLTVAAHYLLAVNRIRNQQYTIKHDQVSGWQIAKNNNFVPVKILPSTVINVYALFLHLEIMANGTHIKPIADRLGRTGTQTVLIMADALSADDYRNLTVRLKTTWETTPRLTAS